jgi:threonine dehydrogenase-like Zn-dependent dehydrogenase
VPVPNNRARVGQGHGTFRSSKIASGAANPATVWTQQEAIPATIEAYEAFDRREPGWTKVIIEPGG